MNRDRGPNSAKLGPCWLIFAPGRVFSRLWRLLCVSWTLLAPLDPFFCFLETSGLDFRGFRGGPGRILEDLGVHFLCFFAPASAHDDNVSIV